MQRSAKKVVVLGTGGTIAGIARDRGDTLGYTAGVVPIRDLLTNVVVSADLELVAEQVMQLDSKDMNEAAWCGILQRCRFWLAQDDVGALVITHGTDTLEETAFFLDATLPPDKPVVLTCAMRPASALVPDGPQNLADAIVLAGGLGEGGVYVVCAGLVHQACDVQKVHSDRLDAFDSGDPGPWGAIVAGKIRKYGRVRSPKVMIDPDIVERTAPQNWPRVEIVFNHAGSDGALIAAMLEPAADCRKVAGIVVAATGNGTVSNGLESALLAAQGRGVRIVRSTRCARGSVTPVPGARVPDSRGLSPVKARIALMLELLGGHWFTSQQ